MNVVHMNGVALLPGVDYTVGRNTISFSVPPPADADILYTEVINAETGATHVTRLVGNGFTFLFELDTEFVERLELHDLFAQVIKHKDHPAVRDAIEKIQVVMELIKEDATIY